MLQSIPTAAPLLWLTFLLTNLQNENVLAFAPGTPFTKFKLRSNDLEALASSSSNYEIESTNNGPSDSPVHTLTIHNMNGDDENEENSIPLIIETGKIGRQAAGAVVLTMGETVIYSTASRDDSPKEAIDFLPLSVEYQERFSSTGQTKGGYNKRDGRPAEHEILTCRLIDRPIRPMIADGWRHETQLLSWVLSYDGFMPLDTLAITASSAALWLSDVPLIKPIAAATVGLIDGKLVANPTMEQMKTSTLKLDIAGTKDAVLMIEGAAEFLPEDVMLDAIKLGHKSIQVICEALEEFGERCGKKKNYDTITAPPEGLQEAVDALMLEQVDNCFTTKITKEEQSEEMSRMSKFVVEEMSEEYPEEKNAIKAAFKDLLSRRMFQIAANTSTRADGRKLDQVRRIDIEAGFLPRTHGSALFTRGETQCIATTTLGDASMRQKLEKIEGVENKRFYLQYNFPPSCVGETGRVGAPGRREVGHGNLAERALIPIIPDEQKFPYTIRVESLITESHGSSSMASVCGGCLSLMDAGVPIEKPVAGIAMGMLLGDKHSVSDENAIIVSDILGVEDALGTMDFKVAGDRSGISTFQLDIKCEGLSHDTMARALEQARQGRLHILDEMEKVIPAVREELPSLVPKIGTCKIEEGSIGKVIGPGGKQIRAIIEDFELANMDVAEDGNIQLSSLNTTQISRAIEFIEKLVGNGGGKEPRAQYKGPPAEVGKIYTGKIISSHNFGVFVEILPGAEDGSTPGLEGLVHVSELHTERVRNCEGFVRAMNVEEFDVKVLGFNDKGKLQLSRKAVLLEGKGQKKNSAANGSANGSQQKQSKSTMSTEETNIIEQAISGINDM